MNIQQTIRSTTQNRPQIAQKPATESCGCDNNQPKDSVSFQTKALDFMEPAAPIIAMTAFATAAATVGSVMGSFDPTTALVAIGGCAAVGAGLGLAAAGRGDQAGVAMMGGAVLAGASGVLGTFAGGMGEAAFSAPILTAALAPTLLSGAIMGTAYGICEIGDFIHDR